MTTIGKKIPQKRPRSPILRRRWHWQESFPCPWSFTTGTPTATCFDILARYPDVAAILHSYSGSPEMARQYLQNPNRYISFSGVLTFKNAVKTVETARIVPENRILSETDCPYLAPVPYRGKMNHSGYMAKTVEKLAEIKGLATEEMAERLEANAKRVFGL